MVLSDGWRIKREQISKICDALASDGSSKVTDRACPAELSIENSIRPITEVDVVSATAVRYLLRYVIEIEGTKTKNPKIRVLFCMEYGIFTVFVTVVPNCCTVQDEIVNVPRA